MNLVAWLSTPLRHLLRTMRFCSTLAATLCIPKGALAEPPLPVQVSWNAEAGCPNDGTVEAGMRPIMGSAQMGVKRSVIRVEASLKRVGTKWEIALTTTADGIRGERTLIAEDCEQARAAVALLLAFMLDPNAESGERDAPETPPSERTKIGPVPVAPRAPSRSASRSVSPKRWRLGLSGTVDYGTLPMWAYGAELRLEVASRHFLWGLRGSASLPSTVTLADGSGGRFSLMEAGVIGCTAIRWPASLSLQFCAGPTFSRMHGVGHGVADPSSATGYWFGALVEAGTALRLDHAWAVRLALGAALPFARPTFAIRDGGPVHRAASLSGRAELGFEASF